MQWTDTSDIAEQAKALFCSDSDSQLCGQNQAELTLYCVHFIPLKPSLVCNICQTWVAEAVRLTAMCKKD